MMIQNIKWSWQICSLHSWRDRWKKGQANHFKLHLLNLQSKRNSVVHNQARIRRSIDNVETLPNLQRAKQCSYF